MNDNSCDKPKTQLHWTTPFSHPMQNSAVQDFELEPPSYTPPADLIVKDGQGREFVYVKGSRVNVDLDVAQDVIINRQQDTLMSAIAMLMCHMYELGRQEMLNSLEEKPQDAKETEPVGLLIERNPFSRMGL